MGDSERGVMWVNDTPLTAKKQFAKNEIPRDNYKMRASALSESQKSYESLIVLHNTVLHAIIRVYET